ncbi:SPT6 [Candida pseudojiufengensis]|uniref:SPT6 n=1 Tax=Candida pseudojiufengensis TaxID=497109 RepID=UPI002224F788|nr:SPT6 [Candida pseudojiufengensis]KAI5959865.1 SPT6 [Candida pseudojiufengensis]
MERPEESEIRDNENDQSGSEGEGDDLRNDSVTDSSEEDDDDDNEEEIQKVREGFIVDDEDEEIETKKRRRHKKRKRAEREESVREEDNDALDEDDLELLMENSGLKPSSQGNQFKRLKRRTDNDEETEDLVQNQKEHDRQRRTESGLIDIFADEEDDDDLIDDNNERDLGTRPSIQPGEDEEDVDDFIEDDEFSDDDEETRRARQEERQRLKKKGPSIDTSKLSNVDRKSLQELFEAFGDGNEYEWALEAQEIEDAGQGNEEPTSLDEVFEHSELKERMLTEEDNVIRIIDVPERFQRYRAALDYIDLDGEELEREKKWVTNIMLGERPGIAGSFLEEPFKESVGQVVQLVSKEAFEVPFIWSHRRDCLLYSHLTEDAEGKITSSVHKLLFEEDLWRIVKLDIEYHSLYEKRLNIEKLIQALGLEDDLTTDIKSLDTMVAIQDIHDYIQFTYAQQIRDLNNKDTDSNEEEGENSKVRSKKHSKFALYDRIKSNILYDGVKAYGITAKQFGENVQDQSYNNFQTSYRIHATDDSNDSLDFIIDMLVDDVDALFKEEKTARDAIRRTFAEEIFHNPKVRHEVRNTYKSVGSISVALTDKGRTAIDNYSPFADIKYAINRSPADLVQKPDVFLRMLEAERLGLAVIKVETTDFESWFQAIFNCLKSDGLSENSDKWNKEREIVLRLAFKKLCAMVSQNTKEDLRRECERLVASEVRAKIMSRIDQAPFAPYGYDKGTKPNVLALSFGKGEPDSAVVGAFVRDNGKAQAFFKSESNPIKDLDSAESFSGELKEFFDNTFKTDQPDVITISGFNVNSKRLFDIVRKFVEENGITANVQDLEITEPPPLLSVVWGQDETARLYQNSAAAKVDYPDKPQLVKYVIGVAHYLQNPILEYVALGDDILSLTFHEHQKLIPIDLVKEALESAFVEIVNTTGVDINVAVRDPYVAKLLPFVAGLGPRKASGLIRNIVTRLNSTLPTRNDLILNDLTPKIVFKNCASFLNIPTDEPHTSAIEILDATRIHPEDYELASKVAADALDLDEEDIEGMKKKGEVVQQLYNSGVEKINELNLVDFGKQIEAKTGNKKFATLQLIKEELVNNYTDLRRHFKLLDSYEYFHMLTGETRETFGVGVVVPVTVVKVGKNYHDPQSKIRWAKVITSSLIQGNVEEDKIPRDLDLQQGQVVQAVILEFHPDSLMAVMSLLKEDIKRASIPKIRKEGGKWDFRAEEDDWKKEKAKEKAKRANIRNIQHPLYRNFNYKQAEEYLAPQKLGDCVIRPSSKGPEYLTITWKVGNNIFQHLSVHERRKGRFKEYYVDGKKYQDLDQLIFQHIQAISKNVDSMVRHAKFKDGTISEVNEWLESYTKANPKSSAYIFCYDHKNPGNFLLLFKVNVKTPIITWHVRTEPEGYSLRNFQYNTMMQLCNGFKHVYKSELQKQMPSQNRGGYNSYNY